MGIKKYLLKFNQLVKHAKNSSKDANPFLVQSVTKSWDISNLWFFSVIIIFHKIFTIIVLETKHKVNEQMISFICDN